MQRLSRQDLAAEVRGKLQIIVKDQIKVGVFVHIDAIATGGLWRPG